MSSTSYSNASVRLLLPEREIQSNFLGNNGDDSYFTTSIIKKMTSSRSRESRGCSYSPEQLFKIPNQVDLPANSVTKFPFCNVRIPFTQCFLLDANFDQIEHEALAANESDKLPKATTALKSAILFRNSSKINLPPGNVSLYFVTENPKEEFFHSLERVYYSSFTGCFLDQMALIQLNSVDAVNCVKERKSFKYEEKVHKITESFSISIVNDMSPTDIVVIESLNRAKQWNLSKVTPEKYQIIDSERIAWHIPSAKTGDNLEIKYTVTYTWDGSGESDSNMHLVEDPSVFDDESSSTVSSIAPKGSFFSKMFSKR